MVKSTALSSTSSSNSARTTTTTSRQNRVSNLLRWAKESGIGISPQIELRSDAQSGLGWFAKHQLKSNDLVLSVPSSIPLVVESGSGPDDAGVVERLLTSDDAKAARKTFTDDLPWYAQMALYLFKLKYVDSTKRDGKVDYEPWLDALPGTLDTPIHWSDDELEQLQYGYLAKSVARQERNWRGHFETVQKLVSNGSSSPSLTWEEFLWGCEMARSRAFSGSATPAFDPKFAIFTLFLIAVYLALGLGTLEQAGKCASTSGFASPFPNNVR